MIYRRPLLIILAAAIPLAFAQPSPNILDWLDLSSTISTPSTCRTVLSGQALFFPDFRAYLKDKTPQLDTHHAGHGFPLSTCRTGLHSQCFTHSSLDTLH